MAFHPETIDAHLVHRTLFQVKVFRAHAKSPAGNPDHTWLRRLTGLVDQSYYVGHGKTFQNKFEQELTEQTEFLSQPISVSSVASC
jgi:hypothetical protein